MTEKRLVLRGLFTEETTTEDIDAIASMFGQRWNMEPEVNLQDGMIVIYKE